MNLELPDNFDAMTDIVRSTVERDDLDVKSTECPNCGHKISDIHEYATGEDSEFECPHCDQQLIINIRYTYEIRKQKGE